MPSVYAHFLFGQSVKQRLNPELQKITETHRYDYALGLQGPDILFYYHPLTKNAVCQEGLDIHQRPAADFLNRAGRILNDGCDDAMAAYILGFICHYILDSSCHTYVKQEMDRTGISHSEIETEFDRFLLRGQKMTMRSFHPADLIIAGPEFCSRIAPFYPGISSSQIYKSVCAMRRYLAILFGMGLFTRGTAKFILWATGNLQKYGGLLPTEKPNPACAESCRILYSALQENIAPAVELSWDYFRGIGEGTNLNGRFSRNFE